jgi:hypothetical protein
VIACSCLLPRRFTITFSQLRKRENDRPSG